MSRICYGCNGAGGEWFDTCPICQGTGKTKDIFEMGNRPQDPPVESYSLHMAPHMLRPTSPPPPRKKPDPSVLAVSKALADLQERNDWQSKQIMLLRGQIGSLIERLGKYECPECGDAEQIVDCHHDGTTCGLPECDYRHCNGCGHQWGQN